MLTLIDTSDFKVTIVITDSAGRHIKTARISFAELQELTTQVTSENGLQKDNDSGEMLYFRSLGITDV